MKLLINLTNNFTIKRINKLHVLVTNTCSYCNFDKTEVVILVLKNINGTIIIHFIKININQSNNKN